MKSEFTREACDLQLKVGIMHVGAYDTNKQKLMSKDTVDFLSSFPILSTKTLFIDAPKIQMRAIRQEICMGKLWTRKLVLE